MSKFSAFMLVLLLSTAAACENKNDDSPETQLTKAEAVSIAKPALKKQFPDSFEEHRPYRAEYHDGIWHVRGTLPPKMNGGTPEAKVRDADGKVLQVFHAQ